MKSNSGSQTKSKKAETAEIAVEKYSLRQRQKRTTRTTNKQTENNTKNDALSGASNISAALLTSSTVPQAKTNKKTSVKSKAKQKAAPLSKYRRKTANARERIRMREINSAFEHLRKCVPVSICEDSPTTNNEKLTKITTLRLAMKYISTLNNMLNASVTDSDTSQLLNNIINKNTMQSDTSNTYMNNNNNSMTLNNNNTSDSLHTPIKGKRKTKKSDATANKAINKRRTTKTKMTKLNSSKVSKTAKKTDIFDSMPNAMSTICLTPPLSSTDSPIDLGLMLESDGESLHLSEPCLSPPSRPMKTFSSAIVSPPSSVTMSNGLDIGLFLDSDTDSLHFPEPCLSPLDAGFDVLSPFGDLLHPGFAEPTSLDIYLT